MTNKEAERREFMFAALQRLGLSRAEAVNLRRASMQLRSWGERECNEDIRVGLYRDGEFWDRDRVSADLHRNCRTYTFGQGNRRGYQIPNRGAGAERRIAAIMAPHLRRLAYYLQGDPRGAALYIVKRSSLRKAGKKPADLPSCYTMGIAVY